MDGSEDTSENMLSESESHLRVHVATNFIRRGTKVSPEILHFTSRRCTSVILYLKRLCLYVLVRRWSPSFVGSTQIVRNVLGPHKSPLSEC